ncbi:DNA polymerase III subunit epsilon [Neochlamydia sp. EPS4]|nr:DNA polymerase III subunit epsilon [Neochlamydia sp. EPS4]
MITLKGCCLTMPRRAIFYDTETTGIKADRDRIIEIAAFDPVNNTSFEKLINPGCPIPAEATAVHNITDEMVAKCASFAQVGQEFIDFCEGDVILIAHNNDAFDLHFLRQEFGRHQIQMPSWSFLDSLKWARRYRPDLPKHTLQFLREIYQIEANKAHRALDDVIVLHQVFSLMTDDLDMETIFKLINKPRELHHMPFGKHQGVPLKDVPRDYIKWLASSGAFDKAENTELKNCFEKLGYL